MVLILANDLRGFGGDDLIEGGAGINYIRGGSGDDILSGGLGADTVEGGLGADTYVFLSNEDVADLLADFDPTLDRVDLSDLLDQFFDPTEVESAYIQAASDGNGNAILSVDGDGFGTGQSFDEVAILQGVSAGSVVTYVHDDDQIDTVTVT